MGIQVVQEPGACVLEVARQADTEQRPSTETVRIPLDDLAVPDTPTVEALQENEEILRACDAYDWIMLSDFFHPDAAGEIAAEWEQDRGEVP